MGTDDVRYNALGRRVLLSARGYMPSNPSPFELYTEVPVSSTVACSSPASGLRDCGWQLHAVGRCRYGQPVELGGGGTPPGSGGLRCRRDNVVGLGEYGDCVDPAGNVQSRRTSTWAATS